MEKLTLTDVKHIDKNNDGQPLTTKDGRTYVRCLIQTKEHDGVLSGFGNNDTKNWQVGQTIEATVTQNGQYLNFKLQSKMVSRKDFDELNLRVSALEMWRLDEMAKPKDEVPF